MFFFVDIGCKIVHVTSEYSAKVLICNRWFDDMSMLTRNRLYENLDVSQRTCFNCHDKVESEHHVLLNCPLYEDLQLEMYSQAFNINPDFYSLSDNEKISYLFSSNQLINIVAKTCKEILDRRRRFLYK